MTVNADTELLTVAVTLDGVFGFIGREIAADGSSPSEQDYLNLAQALTIGYETDGTPRFGFHQLPLGLMDPRHLTLTRIPRSNISYTVTCRLNDEHKAAALYRKFFDELAETAETEQAEESN